MNAEHFKQRLLDEKKHLEGDLGAIASKEDGSYHAKPAETDETTFRDEVADRLEEMDERIATEGPLEARLDAVTRALKRLDDGSFGNCEVCGKEIENDRLEANPAARTCISHIESELTLP